MVERGDGVAICFCLRRDSRRVGNGLNWWCDSHIWHYTTFITLALNGGSWYTQARKSKSTLLGLCVTAGTKKDQTGETTNRTKFIQQKISRKDHKYFCFSQWRSKAVAGKAYKAGPPFFNEDTKRLENVKPRNSTHIYENISMPVVVAMGLQWGYQPMLCGKQHMLKNCHNLKTTHFMGEEIYIFTYRQQALFVFARQAQDLSQSSA